MKRTAETTTDVGSWRSSKAPGVKTAALMRPDWLRTLIRHRAWLFVGLVILVTVGVRLRLRDMPLERDEGEYAYAGQLILQGIAPYKLVYNLKFPGTYAAYALIMAIFGQSPAGIHFGLTLVNGTTIALIFILGRKLLDTAAGVMAAASFALLSLSPAVLGLAAHGNHFVILAAVAGLLALLRACETRRWVLCFGSGLLFGLALLMKQHGAVFGVFGGLYLIWERFKPERKAGPKAFGAARQGERPALGAGETPALLLIGSFGAGLAAPLVVAGLVLWVAGVFPEFVFWTFAYAREYMSALSLADGQANALRQVPLVARPDFAFWILAGLAAVIMWWEERMARYRLLVAGFLIASLIGLSLGLLFRHHYFILLLPAVALLAGVAVSRAIYLFKHDKTIELFLAVVIMILVPVGFAFAFIEHGTIWFGLSPEKASSAIYGSDLFTKTVEAARYVAQRTAPNSRIAVLGSEPQIYFYSRRHSATGNIYAYPLMEAQPYALQMQTNMIRELEASQPQYVIEVRDNDSWLKRPDSKTRIYDWWSTNSAAQYDTDQTLLIAPEERRPGAKTEPGEDTPKEPKFLLIYKRKT